jgi:ribonucleotide monophosphatase NagD (HAD superfamily)
MKRPGGTNGAVAAACAAGGNPRDRPPPQLIKGIGDLADKYDAFLIDQWVSRAPPQRPSNGRKSWEVERQRASMLQGVMHDGKTAYPGAVECMNNLAKMGKTVVLLSNSSRRKGNSMDKLAKMGFNTGGILDLITSGEEAWLKLASAEKTAPFDRLGKKVFVFGNGEEDEEYVTSAGLEFCEVHDAEWILARGMFTMHDDIDVLKREGPDAYPAWDREAQRSLQIGAENRLPMLVTNPDFVRPDGNDSPMPGRLGQTYEQMLAAQVAPCTRPEPGAPSPRGSGAARDAEENMHLPAAAVRGAPGLVRGQAARARVRRGVGAPRRGPRHGRGDRPCLAAPACRMTCLSTGHRRTAPPTLADRYPPPPSLAAA